MHGKKKVSEETLSCFTLMHTTSQLSDMDDQSYLPCNRNCNLKICIAPKTSTQPMDSQTLNQNRIDNWGGVRSVSGEDCKGRSRQSVG